MENKIWRLEALRGLAAMYVVLHHTLPHKMMLYGVNLGYLVRFGQEAVILFFLLSGFVIHRSFFLSNPQPGFRVYFAKRFVRIYIPLFLVYIISYLSVSYNQAGFFLPDFRSLLGNLFMLQDWGKVKPNVVVEPFLGNNPLWSLSYEWWFYMAFYPVVRYFPNDKLRDTSVFILSFAAGALYFFYPEFVPRIAMYFGIWWVGVYLSSVSLAGQQLNMKLMLKPMIFLSAMLALLAAKIIDTKMQGGGLLFGMHPVLEFRHFLFAFFAVLIAFLWSARQWTYFDGLIKPFAIFAPASYVIYISHFPLFTDATYLDFVDIESVRWLMYFGVVLAVSFLAEVKLYPLVKRPLIRVLTK